MSQFAARLSDAYLPDDSAGPSGNPAYQRRDLSACSVEIMAIAQGACI